MATKTIAALYDDSAKAREAIKELIDHGFDRNNISLIQHNREGKLTDRDGKVIVEETDKERDHGKGAGIGALTGGAAGLLVGIGALAIPGIGPVLAAGEVAAAIAAGAGAGAATGGIIGGLVGVGIPKEHAHYYAEGLRRGGTLVTVRASENLIDDARRILERHNPIDIERRSERWRESGWSEFDPEAEPYAHEDIERERTTYVDKTGRPVTKTDTATRVRVYDRT